MLFRRLNQKVRGSLLAAVEVNAASVLAHVLIIGALFFPKGETAPNEDVPESFEWAKFLLPKDRSTSSEAVREHITFMRTPPAPGGLGTVASDTKEPERIELEVAEGTKADPIADPAAAPPPAPEEAGDPVMTVLQVDTAAVRVEDSAAPPYPPSMLERRLEGTVAVQYVVDTTGRADVSSFVVLSTTHPDFAKSVKQTLPLMRFNPAIMNSQKVRQLVQQQFTFKIDTTLFPVKKPNGSP